MPTSLIRCFFQLKFNYTSITPYKTPFQDVFNCFAFHCDVYFLQRDPKKFRVGYNQNLLKCPDNGFLIFSAKYFCKCFLMFLATVCVRNLRAGCPNVYGVSLQNNCEPQNRTHASCKGQGSDQCSVPKRDKVYIPHNSQ